MVNVLRIYYYGHNQCHESPPTSNPDEYGNTLRSRILKKKSKLIKHGDTIFKYARRSLLLQNTTLSRREYYNLQIVKQIIVNKIFERLFVTT